MVTSDPNDPRLKRSDPLDPRQQAAHLVLSDEELAKGFVRPVRQSYRHDTCGRVTTMPRQIAETYARNPAFYGRTFCATCGGYYPVGPDGEFCWVNPDGSDTKERVGA